MEVETEEVEYVEVVKSVWVGIGAQAIETWVRLCARYGQYIRIF
jgi:hypothetical protein